MGNENNILKTRNDQARKEMIDLNQKILVLNMTMKNLKKNDDLIAIKQNGLKAENDRLKQEINTHKSKKNN